MHALATATSLFPVNVDICLHSEEEEKYKAWLSVNTELCSRDFPFDNLSKCQQ